MATYLGFEPTKESEYYFISYNSEDKERVSEILKGLLDNGVPLWYDYGIEYGSAWESAIAEKIDHSKAMILFLTKGVFEKGQKSYVKKEWDIAQVFDKKVYVIYMEDIPKSIIPYELISWWLGICEKQSISAIEYKGNKLTKEILKALGISGKSHRKYVFVTYAGNDRVTANSIIKALKSNKIEVVMPSMNYNDAMDYFENTKKAIMECSSVVAIVSKSATRSRAFLQDINLGIHLGKPIIPVVIDDCDIPYDFNLSASEKVYIQGNINKKSEDIIKLVGKIKNNG